MIPRNRLAGIPRRSRVAHQYCFFLHDECVRLLKEYGSAGAEAVTVGFGSEQEAQKFSELAEAEDTIFAMRETGHLDEVRKVIFNHIVLAMVSDCLRHIFEALRCFEKRKFVVALNLLRKPLLDSLVYLSWLLGEVDDFYKAFTAANPEKLKPSLIGNRRQEFFAKALAKTGIAELVDPEMINSIIFDPATPRGLYGLFQHAVHLVTVQRPEIRTTPENFNFIFKNPAEDDVHEGVYEVLPAALLYFAHVVIELFGQIRPTDEGTKNAFHVRSVLGFGIVSGGETALEVRRTLQEALGSEMRCEGCGAPLKITTHNAFRIALTDSWRCTRCGRIAGFPFSWIIPPKGPDDEPLV